MSAEARNKNDAGTKSGGAALALALSTALAVGGGGFFGYAFLAPAPVDGVAPPAEEPQPARPESGGERHGVAPPPRPKRSHSKLAVKELPPVVTNLARPTTSWIRLQAAIVYDPQEVPHIEPLQAALMSDMIAFLRTVELSSVEGPDGLRRLQEELGERASTRFEKGLRDFIIETLVIQ